MCVAAIAWEAHPRWRLLAVGNRDEFHERPSAPLARWQDGSGIIAGRDLRGGGSWLGVSEAGRFALVTNFRVPGYPRPELASRGALVTDWLRDGAMPSDVAMNPFNLCIADSAAARVISNHPEPETHLLTPGVHGLSNGAFHRPWPKTRQLCDALSGWLERDGEDFEPLFTALHTPTPLAPKGDDEEGPEARYSPVFIRDAIYGTRCSTIVAIDRDSRGIIIERRFSATGEPTGETRLAFAGAQ